ncbi:MAG TPA: branched-chain amino acid ABC transporter permease [Myxococcales bacterium]|nr:branched-chain amino acid ABC transporter permease [Myxococcales bacterium]
MNPLAQALVSGLLTGLVYALIAAGLSLIFGVMEIVNFAHGEFLMLSMYLSFFLNASLGWDPLAALPLNAALLFVLGVVVYYALIRRVLRAPMLAQIFATFGLGVFLQAAAQFLWKPDFRTVGATVVSGTRIAMGGVFVSGPQLVAAGGAVATTLALWWLLARTGTGRALLATAEDRTAAALMGINANHMFALAWGLGAACVGIAGGLLSTFYYVFPQVGSQFALIAFVAVALGGFGSVVGAFAGGILIGVVESLAGVFVAPAVKNLFVFGIYLVVVLVRPRGLVGKQ